MDEMTRTAQARPSVDAWLEAQKIALGPIIFQAARLLRDLGILGTLREHRAGLSLEEIVEKVEIPRYGVIVLIEAGLAAGVVRCDEERYFLTPTGFVLLTDASTRVNMNVVEECCFQPAYYLEESIRKGKPVGLHKVFGDQAPKLAVSSTKSMVGHLLGGSAGIEVAATARSIHDGVVHPTLNHHTPGEGCDLDYVPNKAREFEVQYAMSNSFGFGGHNVALIFAKP